MELIYFSGGPRERLLNAIIEAGHNVCRIIVNDPDKWPVILPTITLAEHHGIPLEIIRSKKSLASVRAHIVDKICISAGFRYLFPESLLESAKLWLNVHGSLLPKYRGARTLNWVIANGDKASGVTVHRIDSGIDTGPILLQKSFPLSVFDTGASLYRKTLEFEPQVVLEALEVLTKGEADYSEQVVGDDAQYADRVPEHSEVDPTRPLTEIYDQIRAADPQRFPAFFFVDGQKVCVKVWRESKPSDEEDMV